MNKNTAAERHINCSCCGYDSCEQMADAIFNGFNQKNNCIYYIKKEVEEQKATAEKLAAQLAADKQHIEEQKELILHTLQEINQEFDVLYQSVDDMAAGNENNAADSAEISSDIKDVTAFCEALSRSMDEISDF